MRNILLKLVICCCIIFISFQLFATKKKHENPKNFDFIENQGWGGTNGVISGQIVDEYGNSIPYAAIEIYGKNIKTKADQNGYFTIRGLQIGGHYSLIINAKDRETTIARWIPIPKYEAANIGSFHIKPEEIWTNFWMLTSNMLENGEWAFSSNMIEITGYETNVFLFEDRQNPPNRTGFVPELFNEAELIDEK